MNLRTTKARRALADMNDRVFDTLVRRANYGGRKAERAIRRMFAVNQLDLQRIYKFKSLYGLSPGEWLAHWRANELPDTTENNLILSDALLIESGAPWPAWRS